jgi:hypothetical protein
MKRISSLSVLFLPLFLAIFQPRLFGQCGFGVEISVTPEAPQQVYCVYDTVKLSVEGSFENYQWYVNYDGSTTNLTPIDGATQSSLLLPIGEYGFGYFFVELTRDSCTEVVPPVMLDSWVFNFPAIEHSPQSVYCKGDSTIISNAFGSYAFYQWYKDWAPIPGANDAQYVVRESGTYVLEVAPLECPLLKLSSGVGPTFSFSGPDVPVITEEDGVLMASSGPNFQWYINGEAIPEATGSAYQPVQSGTYTVIVSDGGACAPGSAPFSYQLTSLGEPAWAIDFQLFPNPAREVLNVQGPAGERYSLRLLTAAGKEVLRQQHAGAGPQLQVPIGNLPEGVYICQLKYKGEAAHYRVVVAKH